MDAAALRRVQSGFAEVKSALQRDHNGAGIGLPLSRAIMEAHGGSLDIASRPGEGTRVTVTLPPERVITASRFLLRRSLTAPGAEPLRPSPRPYRRRHIPHSRGHLQRS